MKIIPTLTCALLTACSSTLPTGARIEAPAREIEGFRAEFAKLSERYGVKIEWDVGGLEEKHHWGRRSTRQPADWELQAYAPILVDEFGFYPPSVIRKSGLRRILVCRDLWVESSGVNQNVSGTLDHGTQTMYLCISYTYKVNNRAKQRRVIHHALFHQFDHAMGLIREDPDWVALNPDGFVYGSHGKGGHFDRTPQSGLLTSRYPGFLNRYSTGNLADDKADIFAYMIVAHPYVQSRAQRDPVVAAKMEFLTRRLARFCPDLDAAFWAKVRDVRRPVTPYVTID